jgi:hypothetical protein
MADEKLTLQDAVISIYEDNEIGAAADRIPAALQKNLPGDPTACEFAGDFSTEQEKFDRAVKKSQANPETKTRRFADNSRDKSYLFFRGRTESYIHSDDEEKSNAAVQLMEKINLHGYSLQNEGLDKQTVLMDALILDLQTPQMQEMLDILGVKPEFDSMVKTVVDYKQIDGVRTEAAVKTDSIPLIEARKAVCQVITECNDWIRRRFRKEPQVMAPMVRHWNEIVIELNAQAQARITRKVNEAAAEKKAAENEPVAAM